MIYAKKQNADEKNFIALLAKSKKLLISSLKANENKITPLDFENLVFEKMKEAAIGTEFDGTIQLTGKHAFPDIIANKYFGVEVKTTIKDTWISIGNSIFETLRSESVERIFIMFGKLAGDPDVRFRPYQECLSDISVTHSPRYKINMELPNGQSIFNKMGIDYDTFRKKKDSIKLIKNYFRKKLKPGEELWWTGEDNEGGNKDSSLIIKPFRSLNKKDKEKFIIEAMILFPEIFGNNTTKFERATAYLVKEYNVVSASLRDNFTSGGQKKIKIKGDEILVPKIFFHLFSLAEKINHHINSLDEETLSDYWKTEIIQKDKVKQWKQLLDSQNTVVKSKLGYAASEIFEAGL